VPTLLHDLKLAISFKLYSVYCYNKYISYLETKLGYTVYTRRSDLNTFYCRFTVIEIVTRKAAQGVAQCEVSATRVVVDAALLRGGCSEISCNVK